MTGVQYEGRGIIEGGMMTGPHGKVRSALNEDNEIAYKIEDIERKESGARLIPLLRGLLYAWDALAGFVSGSLWSASLAGRAEDDSLTVWRLFWSCIGSLLFAFFFFVLVPVFGTAALLRFTDFPASPLFLAGLRLVLLLLWLIALKRFNDIKRLTAYQTAANQALNCYESGRLLTAENARTCSRIHSRAEAGFLLPSLFLSVLLVPLLNSGMALLNLLLKLGLIALLFGFCYEIWRLRGLYPNSALVRILTAPGVACQYLTTYKRADMNQLEVAVSTLRAVPGYMSDEVTAAAQRKRSAFSSLADTDDTLTDPAFGEEGAPAGATLAPDATRVFTAAEAAAALHAATALSEPEPKPAAAEPESSAQEQRLHYEAGSAAQRDFWGGDLSSQRSFSLAQQREARSGSFLTELPDTSAEQPELAGTTMPASRLGSLVEQMEAERSAFQKRHPESIK